MDAKAQPLSLDSLVGEVLQDRYQLLRKAGEGGMAWVFQGLDLETQQQIAVKVLLPELAQRHKLYERFRREAHIQMQLQHPGIVQVLGQVETHGLVGMWMTWAEGSLVHILGQRDLTLPEVAWLLPQLLDALSYAHQKGIIHRDLKPDNILMCVQEGSFIPQISDFGIAKILNEAGLTRTGACMGTPQYMPPEQWVDSKHVDPRADVYSMGVLLYRLLVGHLPFQGSYSQLLWKVINEEPVYPSHLNDRLVALLRQCLAKQPERRFDSCATLLSAWNDCMRWMGVESQDLSAHGFVAQPSVQSLTERQEGFANTPSGRSSLMAGDAAEATRLDTPPGPSVGTVGYGEESVPSLLPTLVERPQAHLSRIDDALRRSIEGASESVVAELERSEQVQTVVPDPQVSSWVGSSKQSARPSSSRWVWGFVVAVVLVVGFVAVWVLR